MEFADLREQSIAINAMTVNGKDLFDARAASTQYIVDFSQGAQSSDPATGGFLWLMEQLFMEVNR